MLDCVAGRQVRRMRTLQNGRWTIKGRCRPICSVGLLGVGVVTPTLSTDLTHAADQIASACYIYSP